mmetsp:Transcript_9340/g.23400  ORF Transcript_9340/g.23400 Transcript_9340/m.23400 type:complete len:214 (-) Transcript_9340:2916-3557(-)
MSPRKCLLSPALLGEFHLKLVDLGLELHHLELLHQIAQTFVAVVRRVAEQQLAQVLLAGGQCRIVAEVERKVIRELFIARHDRVGRRRRVQRGRVIVRDILTASLRSVHLVVLVTTSVSVSVTVTLTATLTVTLTVSLTVTVAGSKWQPRARAVIDCRNHIGWIVSHTVCVHTVCSSFRGVLVVVVKDTRDQHLMEMLVSPGGTWFVRSTLIG